MSEYWKKLSDRRWQRKRLEILERAGFECESCGDASNEKQLHVHHTYYEKGMDPWEYPDESLLCVCKDCHKRMEEKRLAMLKLTIPADHEFIIGYSKACKVESQDEESVKIESGEEIGGVCCALRVSDPFLQGPIEKLLSDNDYVLTYEICAKALEYAEYIRECVKRGAA